MARGKKTANGTTPTPDSDSKSDTRPLLNLLTPSTEDRDVVKVNNANLTELKNACDDAVKRFLSRPDLFKQSHTHTDVRLALGWASVFVAAGTAFYGWRIDFEESKPVMWVGLIVYIALTALQTLYAYFVEGDIVFVGKRKTFDKRIVTERITLASRTSPAPPAPKDSTSSTPSANPSPQYTLNSTYIRSTNAGKSLLAKRQAVDSRGYSAFFDVNGVMDQGAFEAWVGELVGRGMDEGE
uniref:Signal peptidase complex subunit 2 n=1 Tax=Dentipellis fragilis TaxID=205917 RepID=A0A4Y9XQP7_9AGAM